MPVYFLKVGHLVKIGVTQNIELRVASLMAALPEHATFIGWIAGDVSVENHFHQLFGSKRMKGEWFNLDESEIAAIRKITISEIPTKPKRKRQSHIVREGQEAKDSRALILRRYAAYAWPELSQRSRIDRISDEMIIPRSRAFDLYYAAPRMRTTHAEIEAIARLATRP